jgi:hypothetical protein
MEFFHMCGLSTHRNAEHPLPVDGIYISLSTNSLYTTAKHGDE